MNSKAKAPVFQQTSNKQFHERSVGEKSVKTAPHFKEKFDGRGEAKTREKLTGNKFRREVNLCVVHSKSNSIFLKPPCVQHLAKKAK